MKRKISGIFFLGMMLVAATSLWADAEEREWQPLGAGFSPLGTPGIVTSLAHDGTFLYAGGEFTNSGDLAVNYIARWDGVNWTNLGSGMDDWVYALALDEGGDLYAGGIFANAGGSTAYNVAKWNGTTWANLGAGIGGAGIGSVWALALDEGGNLYAGGWFTEAGGAAANNVAMWNGSSWANLGSGVDSGVYALALDGAGNLYAGGQFTEAGGVAASKIAMWNGTTWVNLGDGLNGNVYALVHDGMDLYAGGIFTASGLNAMHGVARWDGASWERLGDVEDGFPDVDALAHDGTHLYVGGDGVYDIARWDGAGWIHYTGLNFEVRALALQGTDIYAGGSFTHAGDIELNRVARLGLKPTWTPGALQLRAVALTNNVVLRWTDPLEAGFGSRAVMIRACTDAYPATISAGTEIHKETNTDFMFVHTNLPSGVTHYYSIFASPDGETFVEP